MGALIIGIGALMDKIPKLETFLNKGIPVLEKIGYAIGSFLGNIVGGLMDGVTSGLPIMGERLSQFGDNLQPFLDAVQQIDTNTLSGVSSLVKMMGMITAQSFKDSIASFLTGESSMDKFATQITEFGKAIIGFSNTLKKNGGIDTSAVESAANAGKLLAALKNSLSGDSGAVIGLFTKNKDLASFGTEVEAFGKAMAVASKALSGDNAINQTAIESATKAGTLLAELQKAIPEDHWFDGKMQLDEFGDKIKKFGESIAKYGNSIADTSTEKISSSIIQVKRLVHLVEEMSGLDTSGVSAFSEVKNIGKAISKYADYINGADWNQIDNSLAINKSLKDFIQSLKSFDSSGVETFKNAVNDLSKIGVSDITKGFNETSNNMRNIGEDMGTSLIDGFSSKQNTLNMAVIAMLNALYKTMVAKVVMYKAVGIMSTSEYIAGMQSKTSVAVSTVSYMASCAASGIRGHYNSFYNNGVYLGSGLVIGINSKQNAAYNAGYNLGAIAAKGERDGQKSHSPSKLTIQSGKWLGEGLIIGIAAMEKDVYKAGFGTGRNAVESISDAISTVSDLLGNGLESVPTIRPVVDLTNVQAGVNALNGMFGTQRVGVNADLKAINATFDSNRQNGNNDEVIRAINKLSKTIGNSGNTYNSINGVTYESGSEVSDAIETLVRAATIGRRR